MGNRYPPREGSVSDCNSIHVEDGSNKSHRSYPQSSSSSDTRSTNATYTNVQNPTTQYQSSMGTSSSHYQYSRSQYPRSQHPRSQYPQTQYPQSYSAPASNSQQQPPLTQQTLYANHTQDVNPQVRQQREQQQYASRVAAARSLGIDTTNPMFASVARERRQSSRPTEAYAAEPDPRYLAVAPLQASHRQDGKGTRL